MIATKGYVVNGPDGIKETQEMLQEAYERTIKSDVRYHFVIDLARF